MSDLAPWMDWMRSHIGEAEVTGETATAFDKEVFSHTTDDEPINDGIMQAGCAATACAALEETGFKSTHDASAISFKEYGTPCQLQRDCIVVFEWDNGGHHVAFCDHIVDDNLVACLGGNQNSRVCVATFSRKFIIATRWPVTE